MRSWKLLAREFAEMVFKCGSTPAGDEIEVEQGTKQGYEND